MFPSKVAVYVHATDQITRHGLTAQLRAEPGLTMIELDDVGPESVVIAAVDSMSDQTMVQLRALRAQGADHLVIVAGSIDDAGLLKAIEIGVATVVPRAEATPSNLAQVAVRALRGEAALPADALARLLKQISRLQHNVLQPQGLTVSGLTTRETEVLRLVANGLDTDEIAAELSYSSRTVKNILHGVTTRFCLRNRSHAVAYAMREGMI